MEFFLIFNSEKLENDIKKSLGKFGKKLFAVIKLPQFLSGKRRKSRKTIIIIFLRGWGHLTCSDILRAIPAATYVSGRASQAGQAVREKPD